MSHKFTKLCNIVNKSSCILLDIEGTTTSIDFVRKDLYNYGKQYIQSYVIEHWNESEVQKVVKEISKLDSNNESSASNVTVCSNSSQATEISKAQEAFICKLKCEMKSNQKTPAVKELEGLVWMNGFIKGNLTGHLYPDVLNALKVWNSEEKKIFIYSNGSVQSQQILFGQSTFGDLRKFIHGHFDTTIGSKIDSESYSKICQHIGKEPREIVFFSDRPLELYAAKEAGLNITLVVRNPDNLTFAEEMSCLTSSDPVINSFADVIDAKESKITC